MISRKKSRTVSDILQAMLELWRSGDADSITVKKLCCAAGVNKSTFYLHFNDIQDCRNQCLTQLFESMLNHEFFADIVNPDAEVDVAAFVEGLLDYFEDNFYVGGSTVFHKETYGAHICEFKEIAISCLKNRFGTEERGNKLIAAWSFIIGGITDVIYNSVNEKTYNRRHISAALMPFVSSAVQAYRTSQGYM